MTMGRVETKFKKAAEAAGKSPKAYMQKLVEHGVTQRALAERLGCTRQAVGRIATKYEVEFPGCEIGIDAVAKEVWDTAFDDYVRDNPEKRYVDMAEDLDVSLSTFKRRVKAGGLNRRAKKAVA